MKKVQKFEAGRYYIGDLCYVVEDKDWMPLLKETNYLEGENIKYKNRSIFSARTAYGDGVYKDNFGHEYGVDAGILGIMPMDIVHHNPSMSGGMIWEFDEEFTVSAEDGFFVFGHVRIETKEEEEDDEDEEYDEDDNEEKDWCSE
jgi:hypothetical protein